jgi:hypothetical protein
MGVVQARGGTGGQGCVWVRLLRLATTVPVPTPLLTTELASRSRRHPRRPR